MKRVRWYSGDWDCSIEMMIKILLWKNFRDLDNRPLQTGWPLNTVPLNTGSTVWFLFWFFFVFISSIAPLWLTPRSVYLAWPPNVGNWKSCFLRRWGKLNLTFLLQICCLFICFALFSQFFLSLFFLFSCSVFLS